MAAVVTDQFRILNAGNFIDSVSDTNNSYYAFLGFANPSSPNPGFGRTSDWDTNTPNPIDNRQYISQYRDASLFGKKITSANVRRVIRKVDWTSNTAYDMYRHDYSILNQTPISKTSRLYDANYYVVNSDFRVYICIDNGSSGTNPTGGRSLDEPTFTDVDPSSAGSSGDGYVWKYLFSVSPSDIIKFDSTEYVVVPNDWATTTTTAIQTIRDGGDSEVNDNQIIFQKRSSLANHTTIYLSSSNSASTCNLGFAITSGTFYMNVTSSIEKGVFKHVSAVYDKNTGEGKLITYNTSSLVSTVVSSSNRIVFNDLNYFGNDLFIGKGENFRIETGIFSTQETFSGSIDEIRYFHEEKKLEEIQEEKDKTLYSKDSLKLQFRFNEPYGDYIGNNIAIDSSKNNLSTRIKNFNYLINRATGSFIPLISENIDDCVIIFPDYLPIKNYYNDLIASGSEYDDVNPNIITKLIPPHYLDIGNVFENFSSNFSNINKTFDNIKKIETRES